MSEPIERGVRPRHPDRAPGRRRGTGRFGRGARRAAAAADRAAARGPPGTARDARLHRRRLSDHDGPPQPPRHRARPSWPGPFAGAGRRARGRRAGRGARGARGQGGRDGRPGRSGPGDRRGRRGVRVAGRAQARRGARRVRRARPDGRRTPLPRRRRVHRWLHRRPAAPRRGARCVAVDVGYGQLAWALAQ